MPPKNVVQLQDLDGAITKFDESFISGKPCSPTAEITIFQCSRLFQRFSSTQMGLASWLDVLADRSHTSWILSKGARQIAFRSQSGAHSPSATRLVGDHIDIFRGDVSDLTDVDGAVAWTPSAHPVSGVIYAAMVLRDGTFHSMTHANWHNSSGPKVRGAFNFHKALEKVPLGFFLVTSSMLGMLGTPSQTNYAAANAFMVSCTLERLTWPACYVNCPSHGAWRRCRS